MRIRTQFTASVIIFAALLCVISVLAFVAHREVKRLRQQRECAVNLERSASLLWYASNEYLLYQEDHLLRTWESAFAAFSDDLSSLRVNKPEQRMLVERIQANRQRLQEVFGDAVSGVTRSAGAKADLGSIQLAWSRLAEQNQEIAADALRLSQLLAAEAGQVSETRTLLTFSLIGAFSLYILTNLILLNRRTLASLASLRAGTEIIGAGNLDFSITGMRDDELGELSRAFNRMTANLKSVTASKTSLEHEIAERRLAEEKVLRLNAELEQRVAARTAELRRLASRVAAIQDEEQRRIAEGLHDGVAQLLVACTLKLADLPAATSRRKTKITCNKIEGLLIEAQEAIRNLTFELTPATLGRVGLGEAIKELCENMTDRHGVLFGFKGRARTPPLPAATKTVLFKATRELMFNVVKHADVKEATAQISEDDVGLRITVEDHGKGFRQPSETGGRWPASGLGLLSVAERMTSIGGALEIQSTPNDITRASLVLPTQPRAARPSRGP